MSKKCSFKKLSLTHGEIKFAWESSKKSTAGQDKSQDKQSSSPFTNP